MLTIWSDTFSQTDDIRPIIDQFPAGWIRLRVESAGPV